ncbi:MAG TPA: hypothetical protein VK427_09470 [Kofleriaceae bacterium]|nr:hypothetical protein [Kofleriaceae bacterium]
MMLRTLVVVAMFAGVARGDPGAPIRISLACESSGRTKACPAFLTGFVEANPVFIAVPRADADVLLYVTANEVALVDRVHLRFVSSIPGTPPVVELDVDLDTRANDDTQRAQLEPAFLRGIALHVAARHPTAVTVAITAPPDTAVKKLSTTPYGLALELGGSGNYTKNYQSYSTSGNLEVSRLTRRDKASIDIWGRGGVNRQPPVVVDGTEVSVDTSRWQIGAGGRGAWLWNHRWSLGGSTYAYRDDEKGQFRYNWTTKLGLEWDLFKPDDPRGNRLAVTYAVGNVVERYNVRNERGEHAAFYPTHELAAAGSVRKDRVTVGLSVLARAELLHPGRRHTLSTSPRIELQLGGHVDVSLRFSITKREFPSPDLDAIDPSDYEQLSRLSYADPLQINGSFEVRIHWDRTNGARNDRFDSF